MSRGQPRRRRFCTTCGSALGPLQTREKRKTITVLFADVIGSTALASSSTDLAPRGRGEHEP